MVQARHTTARGKPFDMTQMRNVHAKKPALGNASKNARGDIIDKHGIVLKTQEQITAEWAAAKKQNEAVTKPTNIKSSSLLADLGSKPVKKINIEDQNFDVNVTQSEPVKAPSSRRRIIESDK